MAIDVTNSELSELLLSSVDTRAYSSRRAAELAGITYRQIDYWERTGVLHPSVKEATGSGTARRYSGEDVRVAAVFRELSNLGAKVAAVGLDSDRVRRAIRRGDRWLIATLDGVVESCAEDQIGLAVELSGSKSAWLIDLQSVQADIDL